MTDETKRQIHRMAGEGLSNRAIARTLGVTHPTVAAVLASAAPLLVSTRAPAPSLPDVDAPPADDAPALDQARYLLSQARADLRRAQVIGDSQLAQRNTRNAAFLMNVLARLEREQDSAGAIVISEADFAAAVADLESKARAYAERGGVLRCADCNRLLSVQWGLGSSTEAD